MSAGEISDSDSRQRKDPERPEPPGVYGGDSVRIPMRARDVDPEDIKETRQERFEPPGILQILITGGAI